MSESLLIFLSITVFVLFITILVMLARIKNFKNEIKEVEQIYTVELKAKCVRTDTVTVAIIPENTHSGYEEGAAAAKYLTINNPTYSCDYAGHNRCFYRRYPDYKPQAKKGYVYTIYLNPKDEKYHDFVDEFFFSSRKKMIQNSALTARITAIIMVVLILIIYFFA